ncbi:hypothetical protein I4U23_006787 [Adineta vaga]|nr:hypothetical protein I4U23_006787 [Adineta vaga]
MQFRLIRVVLGNEACDLDSTISACIYAYFLHSTCETPDEILHLPILNTHASIFRLRHEILWFLKENPSNLIFIDDINLDELFEKDKLEIILVDHHVLRSKLNKKVIEIIDHHQIKENSILLKEKCAADTTGMSVQDLLQKDVKQVVGPNLRLAVSSLPSDYTVEKLIGQLHTMNDLDEFLTKNDNADAVIMLSLETNSNQPKRQLGFYAKKFENMLPINEYIQRSEHNLDLRERGIPINQARLKLFEQNNAKASRKEILPVIEQFAKDFVPQNSS